MRYYISATRLKLCQRNIIAVDLLGIVCYNINMKNEHEVIVSIRNTRGEPTDMELVVASSTQLDEEMVETMTKECIHSAISQIMLLGSASLCKKEIGRLQCMFGPAGVEK
jgi:hypothetical protein